jgi:hypothetical protein
MKHPEAADLNWHDSELMEPVIVPPKLTPKYKMVLFWIYIAVALACSLIAGCVFFFGLFFNPGWANGWPFGLSFQLVISVAITCYASIMLMAVAASVGAIVEVVVALSGATEERQWQFYRWWLCFAAVIVLCLSVWGFRRLYTWVWKQFPDGYVITQGSSDPGTVRSRPVCLWR